MVQTQSRWNEQKKWDVPRRHKTKENQNKRRLQRWRTMSKVEKWKIFMASNFKSQPKEIHQNNQHTTKQPFYQITIPTNQQTKALTTHVWPLCSYARGPRTCSPLRRRTLRGKSRLAGGSSEAPKASCTACCILRIASRGRGQVHRTAEIGRRRHIPLSVPPPPPPTLLLWLISIRQNASRKTILKMNTYIVFNCFEKKQNKKKRGDPRLSSFHRTCSGKDQITRKETNHCHLSPW